MKKTFQELLKDKKTFNLYLSNLKHKYKLSKFKDTIYYRCTILPQEIIRDYFLDQADPSFEDAVDEVLRLTDEQLKHMSLREFTEKINTLHHVFRIQKGKISPELFTLFKKCTAFVTFLVQKRYRYIKRIY